MSRTRKREPSKMFLVKFIDKHTGWYGESCWSRTARRLMKRVVRRHNRRVLNQLVEE